MPQRRASGLVSPALRCGEHSEQFRWSRVRLPTLSGDLAAPAGALFPAGEYVPRGFMTSDKSESPAAGERGLLVEGAEAGGRLKAPASKAIVRKLLLQSGCGNSCTDL